MSIRCYVIMLVSWGILFSFGVNEANSLPFNTDMMSNQPANGRIMRPQPKDSVATNGSDRWVGTREEAGKLTNPVPKSPLSIAKGERLFATNCSPCHGKYIDGQHILGAVFTSFPGPNLAGAGANGPYAKQSDGFFFQNIHFGGAALMPAYGYKFSISEHWDIVNYLRHIQETVGAPK
jgi:mono/diheme cytochrome c family protein